MSTPPPTSRAFKDAIYEQFSRITKALASPKRLEIVDVLAQGERTVEALAREIGQSVANTSRHLQTLRTSRLVEVRRDGLYAYYRLADEQVVEAWSVIRSVGERRLAEIDRTVREYLHDKGELDTITSAELLARLEAGDVVLLDVRPGDEYRAGHIPKALSMPVAEIAERLAELPPDKEIVAYCRGPYCVMSYDALAVLHRHGRSGVRLADGLPEWRAAGRPVWSEADA